MVVNVETPIVGKNRRDPNALGSAATQVANRFYGLEVSVAQRLPGGRIKLSLEPKVDPEAEPSDPATVK